MIKRIFKKIFLTIRPPKVKFRHGQRFYSNSLIDTLFPELVEIGDDFISAPGSIILAHDASILMHMGKYRVQKTIIGNGVTKNVVSGSVVAGNPARVISTVDEYLNKCKKREILYTANENFIKLIEIGGVISEKRQDELRQCIYSQLKNKKK